MRIGSPVAHGIACLMMSISAVSGSDLEIQQAADRSVTVQAESYRLAVDGNGKWTSLVIAGTEMLGEGMDFPSKKPVTSINVRDRLVAIRNEDVIIEFSLDSKGFEVHTSGGAMRVGLTQGVTAYLTENAGVKTAKSKSLGNVIRVIAGEAAFQTTEPFHIRERVMTPSVLARGQKPDVPFQVRFECGVSSDPEEMVELASIEPTVPKTKTVPEFVSGQSIGFQLTLKNLGPKVSRPELVYNISTAFVDGKLSSDTVLPVVEFAPGEAKTVDVIIPEPAPGIHWVNFEIRKEGRVLKRERTAFVFNRDQFQPESTRPSDFLEFWTSQLAALRKVPIESKIKEIPEKGSEVAGHYEIELNGPGGRNILLDAQVPRKPGRYPAMFGGKLPEKAAEGEQILISYPHGRWPEEATYNRWVSASDNNHVDCYLEAVRITDYLRSREDVDRIFLFGASRQGPIQLVNASLDPSKISAVDAHVPTSMGLSWPTMAYRGWGKATVPPEMAAYVDPVNFAPDLTVPVMLDIGVYDGLSPAPGALAFYNALVKTPWKRLSIEPGGHGFFTSGFRPATRKELEDLLGRSLEGKVDDSILREH